jgi:hypothetical protein
LSLVEVAAAVALTQRITVAVAVALVVWSRVQ